MKRFVGAVITGTVLLILACDKPESAGHTYLAIGGKIETDPVWDVRHIIAEEQEARLNIVQVERLLGEGWRVDAVGRAISVYGMPHGMMTVVMYNDTTGEERYYHMMCEIVEQLLQQSLLTKHQTSIMKRIMKQ